MPGPGRQPRGMKSQVKNPGELFLRLMKYVLKDYKFHCISVVVLIVVSVLCNVQGTMFMKNLIDEYITPFLLSDNPNFTPLAHAIAKVAAFYALGVLATFGYNRLMVNVTQQAGGTGKGIGPVSFETAGRHRGRGTLLETTLFPPQTRQCGVHSSLFKGVCVD